MAEVLGKVKILGLAKEDAQLNGIAQHLLIAPICMTLELACCSRSDCLLLTTFLFRKR